MTFKGDKKSLPVRYCETCNKPMTWRKKWEKYWGEVKYCSKRCRREGRQHPPGVKTVIIANRVQSQSEGG